VGTAEGYRLVTHRDPHVHYDPLGPGFYVIAVSIGLMAIGVLHLAYNYGKLPAREEAPVDRRLRIRMISSILSCAAYIFLMSTIGYLLATLIYFLIEFRVEGVKSWRTVVILSLVLAASYYIVFVRLCEMVFPRGILF
jgi:hypothetical protein